MKANRLLLVAMAALLMAAGSMDAKIRLPHLIGKNMVLQQKANVRLWGWAEPGEVIVLYTPFFTGPKLTTADSLGCWQFNVRTPQATTQPCYLDFSCYPAGYNTQTYQNPTDYVRLDSVYVGEVWVCAGQSNMEMPVKGFGNCPIDNYNDVVLDAVNSPMVHSIKIPSIMRMEPQEDAVAEWRTCSPQTVGDFSATGYFFARQVSRTLGIHVGLIEANKGGSRVESWLTKENLEKYTNEPTDSAGIVAFKPEWDYHRAMLWGNGTFNPILKATVKGILFYQGCSNVGDPGNQYSERLKLLVDQWREQFGQGELPFYFVQIAPYKSGNPQGDWNAKLQEQQFRASQIISNSGLVCTNDAVYPYEGTQIHPAQKQKVGERLAYLALNEQYGMGNLPCKSLSYRDMTIKGDTVLVHFDNDYGAINRFEGIEGFEVAGEDHVFYPARAEHFWQPGGGYWDEAIMVTSPDVKEPVAVRYCFRNWQLGNLKNAAGLPLFPFRTDNW